MPYLYKPKKAIYAEQNPHMHTVHDVCNLRCSIKIFMTVFLQLKLEFFTKKVFCTENFFIANMLGRILS